jgi:tetratricopeptide (TPR) repeat protein
MMTQQQLEATLVDRTRIAKRVSELLTIGAQEKSKHNILLVGPRGIGKSHLTALIYYRLDAMQELTDKLAIAYLREDEWGLTSLLDLLLRIYEAIVGGPAGQNAATQLNLQGKPHEESEQIIWALISDFLQGRSLLLIAENLDTILGNIGIEGQKRLRAIIQTSPVWNILATSTSISSDLSDQNAPFYGFFDLIRLEELSVPGAITLLRRLAASRKDSEMESFIASPIGRARVRAIQHLAGGNPRIFVLFYDVLQRRSPNTPLDDYILEPLQKTIDALTPYYQSKMAAVSPLQQKIILYLCQRRVPATVTAIANGSLSSHQTIANQLKQLLANRYVRVNRLGRESYYELAEPLMRICIEAKSHDREPLRLLVEFLRYWFYREELEDQLKSVEAPGQMREYLLAALKEYDSSDHHHHLDPQIERLCSALSQASPEQEGPIAEELATVSKIAEDWGHCSLALSKLGRTSEAIFQVERALLQKPNDFNLHLSIANTFGTAGRYDEALTSYEQAIALAPKNALAWYGRGRALSHLEKYDEAIASFDTALELPSKITPNIRVMKADAFMHLKRPESVLETLRPVLRSGKSVIGIFALYGWALGKLDRHREAMEYLNRAIDSFPDDQFALTHFGLNLLEMGQSDEAIAALERAHQKKPQSKWTASHFCGALFKVKQYERALKEIPNEIVAHRIFHLLLETYNDHLRQGALQVRLKEIEGTVPDSLWRQAFQGALTEFLGYAADKTTSSDEIQELEIWQQALKELFAGILDYEMFGRLLDVLIQFKKGAGLRVLLSVPLEQRRLLITEEEEQALGRA